jgi:predicted FMN-binding regulatory protein PaiB
MYGMLRRMVERFEGETEVAAYRIEDLPNKVLNSQMARIVGFQIKVERELKGRGRASLAKPLVSSQRPFSS